MNKNTLRTLLRAKNATFSELRSKDPALADEIMVLVQQTGASRPKNAREASLDDTRARAEANQPIGAEPAVAQLLAIARVHEVSAVAGLPEAEADVVAQAAPAPSALDNATLTRLVSETKLTDAQARDVGFAAALYTLADEDTALATAIRSASFPQLGGEPPASTADLAKLRAADWTSFFTSTKTAPPAGTTPESAGAALAERFAALHPGVALTARLPQVDVAQVTGAVRNVAPLFQHNPKVIGARFADLDTAHLSASQRAALQSTHTHLVKLTNAYPGLELGAILDDPKLSPDGKAERIARRVGFVHQVSEALDAVRVLHFDLSSGSADLEKLGLAKLGATEDEQRMVVATFQTYQRVWTLANNVDDAHALVESGFTSALSAGAQSFAAFQAKTGFDPAKARSLWDGARFSLADVALTAGSILDIQHGLFDKLRLGNQPSSIQAHLKKLAGFQDMFGDLAFCDCAECQSILGPAAYFVDLMKYIDTNLRNQFSAHPDHPLDLKIRRPDLWTLELSCATTNDRVQTLDVVDEILENYIAQRAGYAGPLADRIAIGKLVYGQTLLQAADSFHQPFHLPLVRIGAYLAALGHTRAEVAAMVTDSTTARVQAELGLSARELALITTQDANLADLSQLYGMAFSVSRSVVGNVDAHELGPAMGLSREELGQLVATTFVAGRGADVTIRPAKRDANSIQNDVEWVTGLTADALDRMHRFTRLVRKVGWSIPELDLAFLALGNSTLGPSCAAEIAELHAVQAGLGITVVDACALIGLIQQTPVGTSLFDRLFNQPAFVAADGRYPKPRTQFIHPVFRQVTSLTVDPALPRLLTGLAVDLDGLSALARHLAPYLLQEASRRFAPDAASDEERHFALSLDNLTLLYRHARLARLLGVSIDDLFQLLGFIDLDHVAGLSDLVAVLDAHAFWRQSGYPLDDIAIVLGQVPRDATRTPDETSVASQLVASAASALTFTDTVFAVALGTTEQASRDLLLANQPGFVESTIDGPWRLTAGIDLDTVAITIPPGATVPTPPAGTRLVGANEVREVLRPYLAAEVLGRGLGTALGLPTDKVVALAALAGQSLTVDAVVKAVRGDGPIDPLIALVSAMRPLAVLFAAPVWDATAIDFVRQHAAQFGDEPLPHTVADAQHPNTPFLSLPQLRALSVYARLAQRRLGTAPDAPTVSPDLKTVLTAFDANGPSFPSSSDAAMARVIGVSRGLVTGLRDHVTLPSIAALAFDQLDRAAQLAAALGIDGEAFAGLVSKSNEYADLSHAADALVAALGARDSDETTRAAKLEDVEQPIREAKRDALANYLIRSFTPKLWDTVDDLYQYFLIDVEAGGCSTTSRVVAATMSAQLYVHRTIMNLEQDDLPPSDSNHITLHMSVEAMLEWEWRKNFRVWQANRKVFLWPENYLEPDLRDDKTPLFEELEQTLLQTDISDQNVLDAYTRYLAGLEEVASLTIAGAYHDVRTKGPISPGGLGDVLHLFGVTAADPPIYYYRTCENLIASGRQAYIAAVWSPWKKITVQITGRKVSPVVHDGRLHVFWIDIKTRSVNQVQNGSSSFHGYQHMMSLKFTTLRPDNTWTVPQQIQLPNNSENFSGDFGSSRGQVNDLLTNNVAQLDPQKRIQPEAIDDYTLSGPNWDWGWLRSQKLALLGQQRLHIQFRDFRGTAGLDLFSRKASQFTGTFSSGPYPQFLCAKNWGTQKLLYYGTPSWVAPQSVWITSSLANLIIDEERLDTISLESAAVKPVLQIGLYTNKIATMPAEAQLLALPGSEEDGLIQIGNDILLLQGSVYDTDGSYLLRRLGTTLVERIAQNLFEEGLDGLLDTQTQLALAEAGLPINPGPDGTIVDWTSKGVDFNGPCGVYYRELFFHIPFLIANALNSNGRFESAQRWYHYIFDPTAVIDLTNVPLNEIARLLLDRVWRYPEFRGLDIDHLRDILTDPTAIALYKKDPFNPWAIARRRISAFQKAIVMKYVDNLLDWADSLFSQFTMESINEAMMLYIMASDVLGPRPAKLGDCGTGTSPNTYEKIAPLIDSPGKIFIEELESWMLGARVSAKRSPPTAAAELPRYTIDYQALVHAVERNPIATDPPHGELASAVAPSPEATGRAASPRGEDRPGDTVAAPATRTASESGMFRGLGWNKTRTSSWGPALGNATTKTGDKVGGRSFGHAWKAGFSGWAGGFGLGVISQLTPVFCVPANTDLLAYWDRVEDRLYKIRNCMDIDGQKQELALFAPPINPMQLVAMKAAGLSLDDVLGASNGNLPPYRFLYLIDRAKALATGLSGFGAALLSALEKKDAEQLNRLRLTQQMNLVQLTTQIRQLEIQVASESLEVLNRQRDAAKYRSGFYAGLIGQGRNGWETAESIARHTLSAIHALESTTEALAAILHLLPQMGSPFAMKYGGVELGNSMGRFAFVTGHLAAIAESVAGSASLEGSFARRSEGWKNQRTLADHDIKSLDRQISAAKIRLDIANRSFDNHQKTIDQIQEFLDVTDGKFTNLGLYTWLSQQLQTLYRGAYQNALGLAKLAERAFRFERGDDTSPGLAPSYWDPTHAGLLAGEQLLVGLQTLERRFLETNYRSLEVDQAFALSQIDAQALVSLRETGECVFTVSEVFFDLFYPGHYKRRIKAARLTIPCITGPYVNVSATLHLDKSWIRPTALASALVEVPASRSVSIATSTAQNDAGVFELSFRDERYMPFEGLGAISQWRLTLPKSFRQFDYQTINDVILSISYTAEQDGALRDKVEGQMAGVESSIVTYFQSNPARRLFSLRQDFSSAFTRLLRSPTGTQVKIELTDRNFPAFFRGRSLQVQRGVLLLRTASGTKLDKFQITIDGTAVDTFMTDSTLGDLPGGVLPPAFAASLRGPHTLVIDAAGDLAPTSPPPGDTSAIDAEKLLDILLYLEYQLPAN